MKTFLNSFAGTLLAVVLIAAMVGGYAAYVSGKIPKIQSGSYLVVELYDDLKEYDPPGGIMSQITGGDTETLTRVLDNLHKARVDDRIEGVILRVSSSGSLGVASAQEIRAAVKRVQAAGKKVYGYAESFEARQYIMLAACDEILSPPTAYISFTGFTVNSVHIKKTLEKLGINPNLHKIKDYKSAAELVTRESMSEPARENYEWLLDEGWHFFITALSEDRGLDEGRIMELMQHAMFTAREAEESGLVDRRMYWDELEAMLKDEDDDELRVVSSADYGKIPASDVGLEGSKTIAVIHAQGIIMGRESGVNPLLGITMGHESIVAELRRARLDEDVAAIVFRVDSRGGDALSSDLMGHEVELTASVKPVVVSMVDVAASGGYHISYRASRIVADPMTICGSIGSITGKFNMASFFDSLGITHDEVARGPMATMDSAWRDYAPEERQRFEDAHWKRFNHWLQDVAEHRGMDFGEAESLAHGRVWSGRQALGNGLVDELGDFERAVEVAKELAGIPSEDGVTVAHYPKKKSLMNSLLGGDVATAARWAAYRAVREDVSQTWHFLSSHPELAPDVLTP